MKPNGTDTLVSASGGGRTNTKGADPVPLPKRMTNLTLNTITNKIYALRGVAVMLDRFSSVIANFATVQQEGNKSWTN